MTEFLWPYMILFLPLPIIIRWIIFRKDNKLGGHKLKIPFFKELVRMGNKDEKYYKASHFSMILLVVAWTFIVLAAARPIKVADSWSIDVKGRDLMIAIDVSGSMSRPEILDGKKVTRLDVVKSITAELIKERKGDRVGLIVFGSKAFLYSPLSFDLSLVNNFLNEIYAGMAGPQTAIGDAMALGVKYLYNRPTDNKVLLLMTDGVNQGGKLSIEQGLEYLIKANIKVYPIGIGFPDTEEGKVTKKTEVDLDEPALINIAEKTKGSYFRVNSVSDLKDVFAQIAKLEAIDDALIQQSVDEIYYIYIVFSLIFLILLYFLQMYVTYKTKADYENEDIDG